MTIEKALDIILDLNNCKTPEAMKFLQMEATTHNLEAAAKYLDSYWRNR